MSDIKVEHRVETREVFIGHDGREFRTEREALASIVEARLAGLLREGGGPSYDFDNQEAAREIMANAADVIRWLSVLTESKP